MISGGAKLERGSTVVDLCFQQLSSSAPRPSSSFTCLHLRASPDVSKQVLRTKRFERDRQPVTRHECHSCCSVAGSAPATVPPLPAPSPKRIDHRQCESIIRYACSFATSENVLQKTSSHSMDHKCCFGWRSTRKFHLPFDRSTPDARTWIS